MPEWGWAIASAILLITLFQLLVYYYLMRGGDRSVMPSSTDGNGNTSPAVGRRDSVGVDDPDARDRGRGGLDDTEEVRRCSRCGAPNENDPVFTYCRNCGAQL